VGRAPATAVAGVAFGDGAQIAGGIHIGSQTIHVAAASSAAFGISTPPHQAPPLPAYHVARQSVLDGLLLLLRQHCPSRHGSLTVFALHGLGGTGKSTVAAELAHSAVVRELFPDGVLWATLGLQPQIGSLLTSWVRGVGERPTEAWADASATAFLRTVLRERRLLLVVDDVWHEDHIQPFLVGGPNCCVLMTTRRAAIADQVGATLVPVNELDPDESIVLMARRAGMRGLMAPPDEHEARLLTQQLGHLPLAIELVGALVARRYSWAEARRQLITFENALAADDSSQSHAQRKLEACLGLSFAVLRSESLALWQAFAYFCLIPHEQRITASMAATLWNVSLEHAQRWLHALEDDALLRRAPGGYALHSLLHQMAETLFCRGHPDGLGMSLPMGHQELVQRYLATAATGHWADIRDDGYIIDRWTWHLVQADQGDAVFELLGANDADGENRWYQRRNKTGRLSGYLDDLRLARQVALGKRSRWQQIFVALCGLSGCYRNMDTYHFKRINDLANSKCPCHRRNL
jgi:NB-ARC domain